MTLPLGALIYILAGLTALAPLAIDAYLPAMPSMAIDFTASIYGVELSLSLFLAGLSCGQLIGGPCSDHFGRRHTIFSGLIIFVLATISIIISTSLTELLVLRTVQAIGVGIAMVNASAIVRDISRGRDSARNLTNIAMVMMIAPLLAPLIGALILHISDWRGIFIFLFIYTVAIGYLIYRYIPETRQLHSHRPSVLQRYMAVLSHRYALGYLFTLGCTYGALFSFITASPSVYMGYFSANAYTYSVLFGANIITLIVINRLNAHLLHHFDPSKLLSFGQIIQLTTATILCSYIMWNAHPSLPVIVGFIMLFIGSQSFIISNAISSAIEFFPTNSGTATALLGATRFAIGALASSLVSLFGNGTPLPMIVIMTACVIAGLILRALCQYPDQRLPNYYVDHPESQLN